MGVSLLEELAELVEPAELAAALTPEEQGQLLHCWPAHARPEQLAPPGDWSTWAVIAGRGFGKTRCGAEWAIRKAASMPGSRGYLAARTSPDDTRKVMIDGESGIIACSPPNFRPHYSVSEKTLTWPNDSVAFTYSSDEPDQARGPQHHWGWADELAAWRGWGLWDNLQMGLRLGENPQQVVTTTPRPLLVLKELLADPGTVVRGGSTFDNAGNLPKKFLQALLRKYAGTRLGRQELNAEMLEDVPGALWTQAMLDALRVKVPPVLVRIVVAIDPATTSGEKSDMTGIVVAGLGVDGRAYVLEDLTCKLSSEGWASRAVNAYHRWHADKIIAEKNQGGDLVERVIRMADPRVPYKGVHAKKGKRLRAEPVSALYEQKRVHHVAWRCTVDMVKNEAGVWVPLAEGDRGLKDLEGQMIQFTRDGAADGSPDRVDAMVYALTDLLVETRPVFITGLAPPAAPAVPAPRRRPARAAPLDLSAAVAAEVARKRRG